MDHGPGDPPDPMLGSVPNPDPIKTSDSILAQRAAGMLIEAEAEANGFAG